MNNVLSSGDIRHQPFEDGSEDRPSTKGQRLANKAREDSSAFGFCTRLSRGQDFRAVNATLQMVQKRLEN
jgi:hypothetical protein